MRLLSVASFQTIKQLEPNKPTYSSLTIFLCLLNDVFYEFLSTSFLLDALYILMLSFIYQFNYLF